MKRLLNIALDNAVALGVVVIVLFLIIPLPTFLLDFLLIVNIGLAIMILMIVLFYHKQQRGKIYIAVIHYAGDQAGDEVIRCFGKRKYFVKSKTMRKEKTEMAVELYCRQNDMDFMEKIRSIEEVEDVTLIQYNGEYHG